MDMVAKLDTLYPQLRKVQSKCHFCDNEVSEIHHIIGRANLLTRYDLANLLPVCQNCHRLIHNHGLKIENYISPSRWLHLQQLKNIQFQDYLISHNLTRDEFFKIKEQELKEAINGNKKTR